MKHLYNFFTLFIVSVIFEVTNRIEWENGPEPHFSYEYNIALSEGSNIYVIGGMNKGAFEVYNTVSNQWKVLPPIPTPLVFLAGAVLDKSIYIIGGIDTLKAYSSKIYKYDIPGSKWEFVSELPVSCSRVAVITVNRKLYIIGGLAGTSDRECKNSQSVYEFNPKTSKWNTKASMPTARHGHAAVVTDGNKVLVTGGFTDSGPTNITEEFDTEKNIWVTKPPMQIKRGFFGIAKVNNNVYAIAGRVYNDTAGPVEQYNIKTEKWEKFGAMISRMRFGMTVVDNHIYLVGGENTGKSMLIGAISN